jgi:hypothetical protein
LALTLYLPTIFGDTTGDLAGRAHAANQDITLDAQTYITGTLVGLPNQGWGLWGRRHALGWDGRGKHP